MILIKQILHSNNAQTNTDNRITFCFLICYDNDQTSLADTQLIGILQ